jgi:hypothetical protein
VGDHVVGGVERPRQGVLVDDRLEGAGHQLRPRPELDPVGLGHAEQLADHDEGQGEGEPGDEIDGPTRGRLLRSHVGEQAVDQLVHAGAQLFDPADGERARHQAAEPRVVGRVERQDRAPLVVAPLLQLDGMVGRSSGLTLRLSTLVPGPQEGEAVVVVRGHEDAQRLRWVRPAWTAAAVVRAGGKPGVEG